MATAQEYGAAGVVLYTDPEDYAPEGYGVYPDSVMMPSTGAQFGTVRLSDGDLMTPFYPSIGNVHSIIYGTILSL